MCLVEIEKMPKLQTACTTPVAEGMVVTTESDKIKQARKSMIELLLANHPLDCPVCDAGGECELQDMTFKYGAAESKFMDLKNHRDEQQWSPVVYFDRPRCILCYRCVRACGEGMDVWALGVQNRGSGSIIAPNKEDHLECEECGMCIDICPVGALTSGAYRYKTRPWEMKHVGTVCTHCGDGCKTTLGVRRADTGMQIVRGDNRDKSGINGDFLCVKGRYAFDFANYPDRLQQPLIKRDGKFVPSTWEQAFDLIATKFKEDLATRRPERHRRDRLKPHQQRRELPAAEIRSPGAGYQQHRSSPHRRLPCFRLGAGGKARRHSVNARRIQHACDFADRQQSDRAASAAGLADSQQRSPASRQAIYREFLSHQAAPPGNGVCADCSRLGRQLRAVPRRAMMRQPMRSRLRSSRARRWRRCATR